LFLMFFFLLVSLSRSWVLVIFWEIILLLILTFFQKKYLFKKLLLRFWVIFIWLAWTITFFFIKEKEYHLFEKIVVRKGSTEGHIEWTAQWLKKIIEKPWWLGFWSSWPMAYTKNNNKIPDEKWKVPENWFIQIFIETWIIWGSIYCFLILYLMFSIIKLQKLKLKYNKKDNLSYLQKISFSILIWLIWLCVEWLLLHSFEDFSVSLPLFILFGMIIGEKEWKYIV
jgi:hypothetical protein